MSSPASASRSSPIRPSAVPSTPQSSGGAPPPAPAPSTTQPSPQPSSASPEPSSPPSESPGSSDPGVTSTPTTEPPTSTPTTEPSSSSPTSEQPPSSSPTSEVPPSSSTTSEAPPSQTSSSASQQPSSDTSQWQSNTSASPSSNTNGGGSITSSADAGRGPTSYHYVTVTDSRGVSVTSAVPISSHKNNTPAIVGGVVGGVGGALLLAGIAAFFLYRRKKSKEVAFDEKMFDPHHSTRHSALDPLDNLPPAGAGGVGIPGEPSAIDPFPYEDTQHGNYASYDYGNYDGQAPQLAPLQPGERMTMPDARDYMGGYNAHNPGGYGVAAGVGAAAAGAGAGMYADDPYSPTTATTSPTALSKHNEAMAERQGAFSPTGGSSAAGSRLSHYEDAQSQGHGYAYTSSSGSPTRVGRPASSDVLSDSGRQSVYQHTDMLSEPDQEMQEIPPNYDSIRRS